MRATSLQEKSSTTIPKLVICMKDEFQRGEQSSDSVMNKLIHSAEKNYFLA